MASVVELDCQMRGKLRSPFCITGLSHCVAELVLNSLDAKAHSIAIRVDCKSFRVQVVDNGRGISRKDMEVVGTRHMTSKCHSVDDLKKRPKTYGLRGVALASIAEVSGKVTVSSRHHLSLETFAKVIDVNQENDATRSQVTPTDFRHSIGTTVTVTNVLSKMPVRQGCIKPLQEMEAIRTFVETMIIIQPRVSFSLRDDATGKIVIQNARCNDILTAFHGLHPKIDGNPKVMKIEKNKVTVSGLLYERLHDTNKLQYLYVNRRAVACPQLQNLVNYHLKTLQKDRKDRARHPIYVIHVKCPHDYVDIDLQGAEFVKFESVEACLKKMLDSFLGVEGKETKKAEVRPCEDRGASQIAGAVSGAGWRRWRSANRDGADGIGEDGSVKSLLFDFSNEAEVNKQPFGNAEKLDVDILPFNFSRQMESVKRRPPTTPAISPAQIQNVVETGPKFVSTGVQTSPVQIVSISTKTPMQNLFNPAFTNQTIHTKPRVSNILQTRQNSKEEMLPLNDNNIEDNNFHIETESKLDENDYCNAPPMQDANMTLFTYNPENEEKGKNLVMNMFIKSVKGFPKNKCESIASISEINRSSTPVYGIRDSAKENCNETRKFFSSTPICDDSNSQSKRAKVSNYTDEGFEEVKMLPMDLDENSSIVPEDEQLAQQPPHCFLVPKLPPIHKPKTEKPKSTESPYFCTSAKRASSFIFRPTSEGNIAHLQFPPVSESCPSVNAFNENRVFNASTTPRESRLDDFRSIVIPEVAMEHNLDNRKQNRNSHNESMASTDFDEDEDLSQDIFVSAMKPESEIVVSLNDGDRDVILKRDMDFDEDFKETLITQDNLDMLKRCEGLEEINDMQNPRDTHFTVTKRFDFMPKGSSPILKQIDAVEPITPMTKRQFENKVVDAFEDELISVKWKNLLDTAQDPRKFFEDIYKEKAQRLEEPVAKAISRTKSDMIFTGDIFRNLRVIGQMDYKFIVAINKCDGLLLVFDQHAVDERIRLEAIMNHYTHNASVKIKNRRTIFLPDADMEYVNEHSFTLNSIGLYFDCFTNGICISKVPSCLYNKSQKPGKDLDTLIDALIRELLETFRSTNATLTSLPKLLADIINSEACTGAIKFGDYLSKEECTIMLEKLSRCILPFQCAHGRPTISPLMYLNCGQELNKMTKRPQLHRCLGQEKIKQ